jgi:hypothetical protein
MAVQDIQVNPVEAFNTALPRVNSRLSTGDCTTLMQVHFTTWQVPAIALEIMTEGLSVTELVRLHCVCRET